MKSLLITVSLVGTLLASCQTSNTTSSQTSDSLSSLGADRDAHGCIGSAGYTWSKLKDTCIQSFNEGIPLHILNTSQSYQTAAYVLIDSVKQKAEIFVPEESESIILEKNGSEVYTNGKFNLEKIEFCWTLSLNSTKLYQERK